MTSVTDRTETGEDPGTDRDFEWTKTLAAPGEAVLAALSTPDAISSWWCADLGFSRRGGQPRNGVPLRQQNARRACGARCGGPGRLVRRGGATHTGVGRHDPRLRGGGGRGRDDAALPPLRPHSAVRVLRHVPGGVDECARALGHLRRDRSGYRGQEQLPGHQAHQRLARGRARRAALTRGHHLLVGSDHGFGRCGRQARGVVLQWKGAARHAGRASPGGPGRLVGARRRPRRPNGSGRPSSSTWPRRATGRCSISATRASRPSSSATTCATQAGRTTWAASPPTSS